MNSGNRRAVDVWFPVFSQLLFPSVSYLLSWTRTSGHGWASDRSGPAFVWGLSHRRLQVIGSRGRPGSPQRCAWPTQTGMCVTSCLQEQGEECWECWCGSFLCWIAFFFRKKWKESSFWSFFCSSVSDNCLCSVFTRFSFHPVWYEVSIKSRSFLLKFQFITM